MKETAHPGDSEPVPARPHRILPILTADQQAILRPELTDVIEYRKSGLSLNHIVGCPLDCAYCVRHLFANFEMKQPRALMSDAEAVEELCTHRYFRPGSTPIQLFNRATDPMLPAVRSHTFEVLRLLDQRALTNHLLLITRWRVDPEACAALNALRHLRVTLLVTHSGIRDARIEPVDSQIAVESLRTAYEHAERYRVVLYWRPIVPGLNDTGQHLQIARELSTAAHATVFTGLFFRDQIRDYYKSIGLAEPYPETARRKILPSQLEQRILEAFEGSAGSPLFRKTSCAVAYAHQVADYNGHVGVAELCDICPSVQLRRCSDARRRPTPSGVTSLVNGLGGRVIDVNNRAVVTSGLDEQHRYLVQHTLGYQVHDHLKPHLPHQHGRADLGWDHMENT